MKSSEIITYLGYAALVLIGLYFTVGILKISGEGLAKLGYPNNFIREGFSEKAEEVFKELDYDECTEDQCIRLIQELLQVENLFKIQLVNDEGDIQVSLTFIDLDKKLVKTDFCEGCKTSELIGMINSLYQDFQQKR